MSKRIIKKYEQLSKEMLAHIKNTFPDGIEDELISFPNKHGELELGLPLVYEDVHYIIRMPKDSIPEIEEDDELDNAAKDPDFDGLDTSDDDDK